MTIDISPATVGAAATVVGTVATITGKVIHGLFTSALETRDAKIREIEGAYRAVRDTQKTLFDKLDAGHRELQDYKLHAAETYMVETKMEKLIAPILQRLESIERDLRGDRERSRG